MHAVPDWSGVALPCANANVQVFDLDQGGNGNDEIFHGTTNAEGEFSGTSTEWMDLNQKTVTVPVAGHWEDRPGPLGTTVKVWIPGGTSTVTQVVPDVLALQIKIEQNGHTFEGPFVSAPAPLPAPIIPVPWAANALVGRVNDKDFRVGPLFHAALFQAIKADTKVIKVSVYEPYDEALRQAFDRKDDFDRKVRDLLKVPSLKDYVMVQAAVGADDAAAIAAIGGVILACGVVIIAAGIATSMTLIATGVMVALIIAVLRDYDVQTTEDVEQTSDGPKRRFGLKLTKKS